jgi:hypothetical protein
MIFIGICLFGSLVALFGSSLLGGEYAALETGTAIAQVGAFVGVIWYFTARARENKESKTA